MALQTTMPRLNTALQTTMPLPAFRPTSKTGWPSSSGPSASRWPSAPLTCSRLRWTRRLSEYHRPLVLPCAGSGGSGTGLYMALARLLPPANQWRMRCCQRLRQGCSRATAQEPRPGHLPRCPAALTPRTQDAGQRSPRATAVERRPDQHWPEQLLPSRPRATSVEQRPEQKWPAQRQTLLPTRRRATNGRIS